MAGTKAGGQKMIKTVLAKYGIDEEGKSKLHVKIGAKGGKASGTGGFYANRELARIAGAKGGRVSKRGRVLYYEDMEIKR